MIGPLFNLPGKNDHFQTMRCAVGLWRHWLAAGLMLLGAGAQGALRLPSIIGDHMVLQQNQANPIWGWDAPGAKVTVTFAGQTKTAEAGADGKWTIKLEAIPANSQPQTLKIVGSETREISDVLVGEVWMCSGQSNMGFQLSGDWNGDLEALASKLPNLRLIRVPQVGTQDLQTDFKGAWRASTPESASGFSAVGFFFGRYLHQVLGIPVGLIDNAWGGSAAEAWVRRESLEKETVFQGLMERTVATEKNLSSEGSKTNFETQLAKWRVEADAAKAAGRPVPRQPVSPQAWLTGNARPGNIFGGVVFPTLGYGIKGVIWYQGESNAGRAYEYASLFPFLIEQWRKEWGQGDFPFYWVQLADYRAEKAEPGESDWAELRESQTKTLRLPNTGQAVIIDLGEGKDIHPRNKYAVGARLARWALAQDYGIKVPFRSPEFKSLEIITNSVVAAFDCFGSSLRTFDVEEAHGFAVCGSDRIWHTAKASLQGSDRVRIWCDQVENPVAIRYAWADNPVCNVYTKDGLPLTPFRSDDFEMTTKPKAK